MPILRALREPDAEATEAGKGAPMTFVAATGGMKGDGVDLAGLPWDFSRAVGGEGGEAVQYPFLWVHDLAGRNLPLGVAEVLTGADELPLRVAVRFDPDDDFAVKVERKYRSPTGGLAAVSIQWEDVDANGQPAARAGKKPAAHQLWEVSAVPVGMDPEALLDGSRAALRALRGDIDLLLGDVTETATETTETVDVDLTIEVEVDATPDTDNDTAEDHAERTAAAMVEQYETWRWADDADTERRKAYNALLPAYRRLGWTAPEFVPVDELWALDDRTWRGLFLAGELQRVGAELSNKNMTELRELHATITEAAKRLGSMITRVSSAGADKTTDKEAEPEGRAAPHADINMLAEIMAADPMSPGPGPRELPTLKSSSSPTVCPCASS